MARPKLAKLVHLVQRLKTPGKAATPKSHEHTDSDSPVPKRHEVGLGDLPIEVLQQILAHLDCLALLKYRTVCRQWNACIPGNSHALREAMFLPSATVQIAPRYPELHLYFEIYTDMYRVVDGERQPNISEVRRVVVSHITKTGLRINPFVMAIDRYVKAGVPPTERTEWLRFIHLRNLRGELLYADDVDLLKDMLVTTPPVAKVHMHFAYADVEFFDIRSKSRMRKCVLSDNEGVRLVELLYMVEIQVAGLLRDELVEGLHREIAAGHTELEWKRAKVTELECPI